jgi:hypothetical protein
VLSGVGGHTEDGQAHVTADAKADEESYTTHEGCRVATRHLAGTRQQIAVTHDESPPPSLATF